jgi:hypothetical protein
MLPKIRYSSMMSALKFRISKLSIKAMRTVKRVKTIDEGLLISRIYQN